MNDLQFNSLFPALNESLGSGTIKTKYSDFQVTEHNSLESTGNGEHWWLLIEKTGCNTNWVANQLAKACRVPARQVGYAGLKDRHAITQQWFSVQLPEIKTTTEINNTLPPEIRLIKDCWHRSKLKTGFLTHNEFLIRIRSLTSNKATVEKRLNELQTSGVPNYFGPQRFGHQMNNISQAKKWFTQTIQVNNRNKRSLYLSAARSFLFNSIVAERIRTACWAKPIKGDVFQLNGSHSWFHDHDAGTDEILQRLNDSDIHITAALWGDGEVQSQHQCASIENTVAAESPELTGGLEQHRIKPDRRAIRLAINKLSHRWLDGDLELHFELPPGAYATSVLREICQVSDLSAELISKTKSG